MLKEPIEYFLGKYGFDYKSISEVVVGARNCAVMLKNGNIGVCATLNINIKLSPKEIEEPDLKNIEHRIFLTAYFNALLNYNNFPKIRTDILDFIDISSYKNPVMIGNFKPIVKKLQERAIKVDIFDYLSNSENIIPQERQKDFLQKTDAVILTATSIFNNTFLPITEATSAGCEIFVLGPSSLVHSDIFRYKNIKAVFGTLFLNNDKKVLEVIRNGGGTRAYKVFSEKVVIKK